MAAATRTPSSSMKKVFCTPSGSKWAASARKKVEIGALPRQAAQVLHYLCQHKVAVVRQGNEVEIIRDIHTAAKTDGAAVLHQRRNADHAVIGPDGEQMQLFAIAEVLPPDA